MKITIQSTKATAIIDTLGAELKSFQDHTGLEYIWSSDPAHWKFSSPLLFPIVGNLRNNKTIFYGQEYEMPKHGIVRDKEFQVLQSTENSVTFSFHDTPETLLMYPFHFELRLTYTIIGTSLTLTYEVINKDPNIMHFQIGAHPGFQCPLIDGETFSDYVLLFEEKETVSSPAYDLTQLHFDPKNRIHRLENSNQLPLNYEMFQNDAIFLDCLKSRKVSLLNPSTGKGIRVDYPDFESIAFWTPMNDTAPFLCIEPWNGSAVFAGEGDDFQHKRSIQTADINETKTYELSFHILY